MTILKIPPSRGREGRREKKRKRAEKKTSLESREVERRGGDEALPPKVNEEERVCRQEMFLCPQLCRWLLCLSFHNFTFFHVSNKRRVCGESDLKAKNEVGKS